jgi:starch synthase
MPYLLSACDIYAAPSRLEGFGMIQVEANACEKPVIAIDAMAFRDTMVHGETAFLAKVAEERKITEALTAKATTTRRVIESCFRIHERLNIEPACPTSPSTFFFS